MNTESLAALKSVITSLAPPAACLKKTNTSLPPLPPVMVADPALVPATIVSLPLPPIIATDTDVTPIAMKLDEDDPDAFRVSFPPAAAIRKFLPLLPTRLTVFPADPKMVTDPVPLLIVALFAVLSANN